MVVTALGDPGSVTGIGGPIATPQLQPFPCQEQNSQCDPGPQRVHQWCQQNLLTSLQLIRGAICK